MRNVSQVRQNGFVQWKAFAPGLSTVELAHRLGSVVNIGELLPNTAIPAVQSLKPRTTAEGSQNQYSGNYGLGAFPLHTDLAQWALPPRYLLMRCILGSADVFTTILDGAQIVDLAKIDVLQKAIFTTRKRRPGHSGLFRALRYDGERQILRWDPLFLKPLNEHARLLASLMLNVDWIGRATHILLEQYGDTLLIDNWRMLHGRTQVAPQSTARHIERAYLSEIFE
jgi:L-asparagine oxygenase